jgi:hypothetical protein
MDLYTEQEMNEMAASSQQQEFDHYQQAQREDNKASELIGYPSVEESFTIFQTTYLGNNA